MVNLLFYLLAVGVVAAAVGMVLTRNPVRSVLALLASFFCLSVIYLLAGFQFLAAIQILVYGGAVMVLFLFVVMLLNLGDLESPELTEEALFHVGPRAWVGALVGALLGAAGLVTVLRASLAGVPAALRTPLAPAPAGGFDPVEPLAERMFTRYSLPFEATSVLLLATAVGVLVLAKRQRPRARVERPFQETRPAGSARPQVAAPEEDGR